MSDETDESISLAAQRQRHRQYLEEIETAALAGVPESVDPDSVTTAAMDAVGVSATSNSGADPDSVETAAMAVISEPIDSSTIAARQAPATPDTTGIVGEVSPPTVVRTSAREVPLDKPSPPRIPPPAKPLKRMRPIAPPNAESVTATLPITEIPVAIPPSIVPPRPARGDVNDLAAIAGAAAIAPNRLPWERPEAIPQPVVAEPVSLEPQPILEPEYGRPGRSLLWLWYLLILATTAIAGWFAWMWFARDELNPPPPTEVVDSQELFSNAFSRDVI